MQFIYAISDLHIGDGSDRDNFKQLYDLFVFTLKDIPENRLVLVGDIFDIWAYGEKPILKTYHSLIKELGNKKAVIVAGNHDNKLLRNESILRKELIKHGCLICEYYIFKNILFLHGHQFDVYNSILDEIGEKATQFAGLLGKIDPDIEDYLYGLHKHRGFKYGRYVKDNNKSRENAIALVKNLIIYNNKISTVVVGHTHKAEDSVIDGVNYINCGSFTYSGNSWIGIKV